MSSPWTDEPTIWAGDRRIRQPPNGPQSSTDRRKARNAQPSGTPAVRQGVDRQRHLRLCGGGPPSLGETVRDPQRAIWAVASRHSLYSSRGAWPKSLVDYHPTYRAETAAKAADTLCRMMQKVSLLHKNAKPTVDIPDLAERWNGTVQYLIRNGFVGPTGRRVTSLNLWSTLGVIEGRPALAVRHPFRDRVLYGTAPWERAALIDYCHELKATTTASRPSGGKELNP